MDIHNMLSNVPGVPASESVNQKARVLAGLLQGEGYDISEHGVRKWFSRKAIPADWLGRVTAMARKSAPKFDPFNYA